MNTSATCLLAFLSIVIFSDLFGRPQRKEGISDPGANSIQSPVGTGGGSRNGELDDSGMEKWADRPWPIPWTGSEPVWHMVLNKNNGELSESLFAAHVDACRDEVLKELKKSKVQIHDDLLCFLEKDRDLREGTFAAIYPVDSAVFLNLQRLWVELGAEMFSRFKSLCLASSILRRKCGVGSVKSPPALYSHVSLLNKVMIFDPEPEVGMAASFPLSVESFLDRYASRFTNATFQNLWDDRETRRVITSNLVAMGNKVADVPTLVESYKERVRVRSERRSDTPTVSEYIRFLAKELDTRVEVDEKPEIRHGKRIKHPLPTSWPIFPVEKAPWPLLMGLGITWPLDEANYIFDKWKGDYVHLPGIYGERRLHLYGPYIPRDKASFWRSPHFPVEMNWASSAWPCQIYEGGVCTVMSTLAIGTWVSLGVPVYKMGQPGHACLMRQHVNAEGKFFAVVEQSVTAGPRGTFTTWPFQDESHPRTKFAECHYGMALAMNRGLSSWMQTRMAIHFYRALSGDDRQRFGARILSNAIERNPFNAEAWYFLADRSERWGQTRDLLKWLHEKIKGTGHFKEARIRDADTDLSKDQDIPSDDSIESKEVEFRTLLRDQILEDWSVHLDELTDPEKVELKLRMKFWGEQPTAFLRSLENRILDRAKKKKP